MKIHQRYVWQVGYGLPVTPVSGFLSFRPQITLHNVRFHSKLRNSRSFQSFVEDPLPLSACLRSYLRLRLCLRQMDTTDFNGASHSNRRQTSKGNNHKHKRSVWMESKPRYYTKSLQRHAKLVPWWHHVFIIMNFSPFEHIFVVCQVYCTSHTPFTFKCSFLKKADRNMRYTKRLILYSKIPLGIFLKKTKRSVLPCQTKVIS